jgi:hypothetical protein
MQEVKVWAIMFSDRLDMGGAAYVKMRCDYESHWRVTPVLSYGQATKYATKAKADFAISRNTSLRLGVYAVAVDCPSVANLLGELV